MPFDVEAYIEDNLDNVKRSSGHEMSATCPFCDKSDHFYVNADTGHYICFKCDAAGRGFKGIARLMAEVDGITISQAQRVIFRQSVQFGRRKEQPRGLLDRVMALRGDAGIPESGAVNVPLPDEFIPVWHPKRGWSVPLYLKERGISRKIARHWGMGYCQNGKYAHRIVFPIRCPNGESFTTRDATGGKLQPKYLNPVGAGHGRLLYGWNTLGDGDVILVEGPTDVIRIASHGFEVLGIFGKALHIEQLKLLFKLPSSKSVVIMLDPEELEAPYKVASQILCHFENVYISWLPDGVDPGKSERRVAYQSYKAAVRYTGDRIESLKAKMKEMSVKIGTDRSNAE
jgi:DNA primase